IAGAGPPPPLAQGQREIERLASSGAPRAGLLAIVLLGAGALTLSRRRGRPPLPLGEGRGRQRASGGRAGDGRRSGWQLTGQAYHSLEHVVKIVQFLDTGRNGTPGILGRWIPVVWLHFAFNTIIYAPLLAAFFLGGFPRAIGRDLAGLLPKSTARRWSALALNLMKLLG